MDPSLSDKPTRRKETKSLFSNSKIVLLMFVTVSMLSLKTSLSQTKVSWSLINEHQDMYAVAASNRSNIKKEYNKTTTKLSVNNQSRHPNQLKVEKNVNRSIENATSPPLRIIHNVSSVTNESSVADTYENSKIRSVSNGPVTIVVQLSGELGNQLQKMANGFCIQHLIETKLGLKTEIKLRHQEARKWTHAMEWTKEAFPSFRPLDFTAANTPDFKIVQNVQKSWLDQLRKENKLDMRGIHRKYSGVLHQQRNCDSKECFDALLNMLNQTWYMEKPPTIDGLDTSFSIPHVYADTYMRDYCLDIIFSTPKFKEFFVVDEKQICKATPDPDETVFHFRNFLSEMPRGLDKGFEELDANKTAKELFANHKPGEKVAIVSRGGKNVNKYIEALETIRGLKVRYIKGQTGNEDFCVGRTFQNSNMSLDRFSELLTLHFFFLVSTKGTEGNSRHSQIILCPMGRAFGERNTTPLLFCRER